MSCIGSTSEIVGCASLEGKNYDFYHFTRNGTLKS